MCKHSWQSNLENDCIAILSYCYRNQGKPHTYVTLSEALNIPTSTLQRIITGFREFGMNDWALETYAIKYGYRVTYIGTRKEILWVEKVTDYDNEALQEY